MSRKKASILIVDDNKDLLVALKLVLGKEFDGIETLHNPNLILSTLEKKRFDILLLDMNFKAGQVSGNEGIFWMNKVREQDPDISVVFITAHGDVDLAIRSMKEGAVDFIMKSWDEKKILGTLLRAHETNRDKKALTLLRKKQAHLNREIDQENNSCKVQSRAMKQVEQLASKVAHTNANVLILGENGTGKEVLARDIHRQSERREEIFMKVDLGAIPESLFESELFGHKKGAFTDAREDRDGRLQVASGGTLFLDEIGNLPPSMQSKLLSVIQNREVYPVGSSVPQPIDVRIISASNMPLQDMIGQGRFREDLYYRINAIELRIPSLRERKEDLPLLASFFLRKYAARYQKNIRKLGKAALAQLMDHAWPGNIRELEHAMEKAVILSDGPEVAHLNLNARGDSSPGQVEGFNLEENERVMIAGALRSVRGNMAAAARELGINRSTLYQKIKKYGL